MKLLILGDPSSSHIIKWVRALSENGIEITLFGVQDFYQKHYEGLEKFNVHSLKLDKSLTDTNEGSLKKIQYFNSLKHIKKIIREFKPDIIHSHYISSYGLLGALSSFRPFIISVWGSDIFSFPNMSLIHKMSVKFSLLKADKILSTSKMMVNEVRKYSNKQVEITPFGVDVEKFKQAKVKSIFSEDDFVIGTIKKLEKKYGIIYLIQAFKILTEEYPDKSLKLLIGGGGTEREKLENLVNELGIKEKVFFAGYILPEDVPRYFNMLNICCISSIEDSESFGVAALEASACEIPVIASNIGGLPEVVEDGVTGFLVEKESPQAIVEAVNKLINDPKLRINLGRNGRKKVLNQYNWSKSVQQMISIYQGIID